jgi:membrane peptidoglycan carboxypeptidase
VSSKQYGLTADGKHRADAIFTDANARSASTYKYFTMLAALEAGVPSTLKISTNTPNQTDYQTSRCLSQFTAKNGDQNISYSRTETMASAIAKSSNTYFVGLEDSLFTCDLKPILNTMQSLGMTNMQQNDPNYANGNDTYEQSIIAQDQPGLTLGLYPTSPLELTSAYAAAANDGSYCTPTPILSIKDKNGATLKLQRTPCTQALPPQVAREAAQLLTGDTTGQGTSAKVFNAAWNNNNTSMIAGKTGTDVGQKTKTSPEYNTSMWFVGMTNTAGRKLAATMALINVSSPLAPLTGIPGISNAVAQTTADASVAAQFWIKALGSVIKGETWSWPAPNAIPGAVQVPNLVGQTADAAAQLLTAHGFKSAQFVANCAGSPQPGYIAFYGPQYAVPGTTVTYCLSTGTPVHTYSPSSIIPRQSKTKPKPGGSGASSTRPGRPSFSFPTPTRGPGR